MQKKILLIMAFPHSLQLVAGRVTYKLVLKKHVSKYWESVAVDYT
jgi:hypothetical protein